MMVSPGNRDLPSIGPVHAAEDADQGRFARPILADERMNLARSDVKADAIERNGRAKTLLDVLRARRCLAHQRRPAFNNAQGRRSAGDARDAHLLVGEPAPVDNDIIVERDSAVTHWNIVVPFGGALAAALRIGPGRKQEIAGEAARSGMMAFGISTVESDCVPPSLRIQSPAEMRDGEAVHVFRMGAIT